LDLGLEAPRRPRGQEVGLGLEKKVLVYVAGVMVVYMNYALCVLQTVTRELTDKQREGEQKLTSRHALIFPLA